MMPQPKGKILSFDQIKQGKALLKLRDGNYLEVCIVIHKVLKSDQPQPDGNPNYMVNHSVVMTVWKPEEISQLEE